MRQSVGEYLDGLWKDEDGTVLLELSGMVYATDKRSRGHPGFGADRGVIWVEGTARVIKGSFRSAAAFLAVLPTRDTDLAIRPVRKLSEDTYQVAAVVSEGNGIPLFEAEELSFLNPLQLGG